MTLDFTLDVNFDETKVDLGFFDLLNVMSISDLHQQDPILTYKKKSLQWLCNETPIALILCKSLSKVIFQHQDQEAQ